MNIHLPAIVHQGYKVLTHCHIYIIHKYVIFFYHPVFWPRTFFVLRKQVLTIFLALSCNQVSMAEKLLKAPAFGAEDSDHPLENHRKTIGKWENHRKTIGQWENHRKTIGKWENHRKTIGKWENHRKTIGKWENHGKTLGK